MATVIVFGPTGHVGSAVALSAHTFGASKVVLAMRDTTKAIPGLTPDVESSRSFQRVHTDLADPASITAAVSSTGVSLLLYASPSGNDILVPSPENLPVSKMSLIRNHP